MNKITKNILALGLALSIIVGVGGVSVFAAAKKNQKKSLVDGYYATAVSTISDTKASASTSYASSGAASVNSKYIYVKITTLEGGSMHRSTGNYGSATVNFTAPKNCRSVAVSSSHEVDTSKSVWRANTSVSI